MKMTRILIPIILLLTLVYISRFSILSLVLDTEVKGWKYIGLDVDRGSTNGLEYYVFNGYYTELKSGDKSDWKPCSKLDKFLESYIRSFIKIEDSQEAYSYISESNPYGYSVYIRINGRVVFVRGFADFGGAFPSDDEKAICSTNE